MFSPMTRTGYFIRLAVSVALDIADGVFGRIPIFGSVGEGMGTALMFVLWGPAGLTYAWELVDVTEQIDGFIPTATLIALVVGWRNGLLTGKPRGGDVTTPS
jgi:hypothetical protein